MKKNIQRLCPVGFIVGMLVTIISLGFAQVKFGAIPASEVTSNMIPYLVVAGIGFILVVISLAVSE